MVHCHTVHLPRGALLIHAPCVAQVRSARSTWSSRWLHVLPYMAGEERSVHLVVEDGLEAFLPLADLVDAGASHSALHSHTVRVRSVHC